MNSTPYTPQVAGLSLIIQPGGRRKSPSAVADPIQGFAVVAPGDEVDEFVGNEVEVVERLYSAIESAGKDARFAGAGLVERDLNYVFYRSVAVLGIPVPENLSWLCGASGAGAPEAQQMIDFSRLWGRMPIEATSNPLTGVDMSRVLGADSASASNGGRDHARLFCQMAGVLGMGEHDESARVAPLDPMSVDAEVGSNPTLNPARLGHNKSSDIAFFQWLVKPMADLLANGPIGKGWGRTSATTKDGYWSNSGRFDPLAVRICGFTATKNGDTEYFCTDDESAALLRGAAWLESTRFNNRIFVDEPSAWRYFTAMRAFARGTQVPMWFFGDAGRKWFFPVDSALPAYSTDVPEELLRHCIECGALDGTGGARRLLPPVWGGQGRIEFQSREYCAAVSHLLCASPYISSLGASPLSLTPSC